jgi:hypothetical protein
LNGANVATTISLFKEEKLLVGELAGEPYGQVHHAKHPHSGEGGLDIGYEIDGNEVSLTIASLDTKKIKDIKSIGMWLPGDLKFSRNISGFESLPSETFSIFGGTTFIWKAGLPEDWTGEPLIYTFEYSGELPSEIGVAWIKQSSDIWITSTPWDAELQLLKVVSLATRGKYFTETTGLVFKIGNYMDLLTYIIKKGAVSESN